MRIAVTGGTGFIGRYILRHLVSLGHHCRCWHRTDSDRSGFEDIESSLEWCEGELGGGNEQALILGCDAVVHSALYHPGGGFRGGEGEIVDFMERNVVGTIRLIETGYRFGIAPFVFVSTCAVHEVILEDRPLDESHPMWAKTHYGAHKGAIEKFVHSYGLGLKYPISALRPTGVYGLAHDPAASKWYGLVDDIVNGNDVSCRRGGKEVHAMDVARAVGVLLSSKGIAGQAFNCYDMYVSEWAVAEIARELTGSSSHIHGERPRPKHQIQTSKIRALGMEFGGEPLLRASIEELCAR